MTGLGLTPQTLKKLFAIDAGEWLADLKEQDKFFKKIGKKLPKEIKREYLSLKKRLKKGSA